MRRVADEITGEAVARPEFDDAIDVVARWLGARLELMSEPRDRLGNMSYRAWRSGVVLEKVQEAEQELLDAGLLRERRV